MGNLSDFYSNWKEERIAIQSESVCIIPSEFCFLTSCTLPEGKCDPSMVQEIALLALESSSPFQPNDMFWGHSIVRGSPMIQIFSALKSRIKGVDEASIGATYVLPDFLIPLIDPSISKAILKHGSSTTFYEKGPSGEFSLSSEIPGDSNISHIELISVDPKPEFGLVIHYLQKNSSSAEAVEKEIKLPFDDARLYAANMQESGFKQTSNTNKVIANASLKITIGALILALSGIGGFCLLRGKRSSERSHARQLSERDAKVLSIQQKDDRAHELDLFTNKKHAYFRGLDKINLLLPESILFKSLYASEGENFEIKCSASTLEDIEKLQKTLENSQLFKVVKIPNKDIQDNSTINFSLFLTFKKL